MAYLPPMNGGRINGTISGNTAGAGALVSSGTLTLAGGNNITLSQAGNAITISGPTTPSAASNTIGMSNIGNTSGTTGVLSGSALQYAFAGGNNVTLSQSLNGASGTVTISAASQTVQTQNRFNLTLSGNTAGVMAQVSSGTLNLAGGNNIVLSQNGNSVTISGSNQSLQTSNVHNVTLSGNTAGVMAQVSSGTLTLAGGNNIVLSQAGNAVTISGSNQSLQTSNVHNVTLSGNTAGVMAQISSGTLTLAGGNNITLSQAGNAITISAPNAVAQTNQTLGLYASGNTGGQSSSTTVDARNLSVNGSGIVTAGYSAGSLIISASQSVQTQNLMTVNGTQGAVSIAGGANVTVGNNASTITISAAAQSNQTGAIYASGANTVGQSSSSSYDVRSLNISGQGALLAGWSGSTLQLSAPAQTVQTQNMVSVNGSTGNISFDNAGNVKFGLNASTISASYSQTNQTLGITATGANTVVSSTGTYDARSLAVSGAGIISAGINNGTLLISATGGGGGGVALSAAGGSITSGTASIVGNNLTASVNGQTLSLNGPAVSSLSATGIISLSTNGSTVSIGAPAMFSAGLSSTFGNSAGNTGMNSNGIVWVGGNNITLSQSTNGVGVATITISGGAGGGGGIALSGTNAMITSGTASLVATGAASISVNGQTISIGAPAAGLVAVSGVGGSITSGTASFIATGNASISVNGQSISIGAATQSNQSISMYAAGNTTATAGGGSTSSARDARSMSIAGSGAVSVGFSSNSQFVISAPTQTNQNISLYALGNTAQNSSTLLNASNLSVSGMANITVGYSGGALQISGAAGGGGGGGVALSAAGGSITSGTASIAVNNLTASINGQTLSLSAPAVSNLSATGAVSISSNGNTISIGAPNQVGFSAGSNTYLTSTGTYDYRSLYVNGQGNVSVGMSNGTLMISGSGGGGGGGGIALSAAGGAITSGTASISVNNLTASVNGQTLSLSAPATSSLSANGALTIGTAGSTVNFSAPAISSLVGAGNITLLSAGNTITISGTNVGGGTLSNWEPFPLQNVSLTNVALGLKTQYFFKLAPQINVSASQLLQLLSMTQSTTTNSTGAGSLTMHAGIYTVNGSTLNLITQSSASVSTSWSVSSNNGFASITGLKGISFPLSVNMTPGNYWIGVWSSTSSANLNAGVSNVLLANNASTFMGFIGQNSNTSQGIQEGVGLYSVTQTGLMSTAVMSGIVGQQAMTAGRMPYLNFKNMTW